jgi:tetratricopeptide (TPR) repeat protein
MPLAIEIAAARLRLFTPEALAHHLEGGFKALGDGMRGAPAHHRTLRDAVAWSYNLLSPRDKAVFRRLGVFVGGFTLEAAEAVTTIGPGAATTAGEVIEAVGSLVDQSLLRSGALHGEARLTMLESIREFALDQLAAAGESDEAAIRHVSYMLRLAEEIEPHLTGRNELLAVDKLTADQGNLRAALRACLDGGRAAEGLRMACAVWRFWHASGQISEGRRWLEQLLALEGVPAAVRAKALGGLAGLVYWQADYASALSCYEEALALHRELGDRFMEADTLFSMSTTLTWSGDATAGSRMADQALAMFEQLGSRRQVGMVLMAQGFARWMSGDLPAARPLWEASLAIARETGDWVEAATKVLALASIKFRQGEEDAALADALGALRELVALKHVSFTIMALDWVAALAARRAPAPSMRLAGAASRLRSLHGGGMRPEASGLESARVTAGRQLDAATAERLWAEGVTLKLEDAVASALELGAAALVAA